MSRPFTKSRQRRFAKLICLAAQSPNSGERDNALTAARRLADSHGMSLTEAACPEAAPAAGRQRSRGGERYPPPDDRADAPDIDWLHQLAKAQRANESARSSVEFAEPIWWAFWLFVGLAGFYLVLRLMSLAAGLV